MARSLAKYHSKRDFSRSPEPEGAANTDRRSRFVVHEHHARRLHWDLRLEHDGVLLSWAIPNGIPEDPQHNRKAIHVEDHPVSYLDFQGHIPQGSYGAGEIKIWDSGFYECEKAREDELIVIFHGERLQGRYALFRTGAPRDWMIHRMDLPAQPREEMPADLTPMLASAGSLPPKETGWAFEIKWDGVRALLYWQPGRPRIESRNGNDLTARYPEIRGLGEQLGSREAVLDGEIVAFDESGRPSFERLQSRMHQTSPSAIRRASDTAPVTYVIFDLLYLDGQSTITLPYSQRRELLEGLQLQGSAWQTPSYHEGQARALLSLTAEHGLEGLIAKRLKSIYVPGQRTKDWLKVKNSLRQEFVIGGWLSGQGPAGLGALLVGYHEQPQGALRYAGRVGSGFSEQATRELMGELHARARRETPFAQKVPAPKAHFVEPELVAEVEFSGWTGQSILRHSVFKGLRADKPASEVIREDTQKTPASETSPGYVVLRETAKSAEISVQGRTIKLSNRQKILFPATGMTKGQVIDYYATVAPVLLGHLADRPLTLKRYPNGVPGNHFYEKRCPAHRPEWVRTARVWSSSHGEHIDYCLVNDLPTLLWVANLASIELHSSLSLACNDLQPTAVVFDLDPGAPAGLRECCKVALWTRELLENFGLQTIVKTSGLKGLQVYLPMNSPVSYEDTKPFAHALARLLEREHPEMVLSRMNRKLRAGKVLIDWSQNDQHKTTVCAYSLRALERPRVSTPLSWEEVERGARSRKEPVLSDEPKALVRRLEKHGDPFQAAISLRQKLPDFAAKAPASQEGRSEARPRLTRRDLYERARELDVAGRSKMTSAQLRQAIAGVEEG